MLTVNVYVNWLEDPINAFKVKDEEEFKRVFIYSKTNSPDRLILKDEDYVWINRNNITRLDITEEDEKEDSAMWWLVPVIVFIVFLILLIGTMFCAQYWWRPFN